MKNMLEYRYNKQNSDPDDGMLVFGVDWELKLIKMFIEEKDKFKTDFEIINQNIFRITEHRTLVGIMKDFFIESNYIPGYELLKSLCCEKTENIECETLIELLGKIKELSTEGESYIKKKSIEYIKKGELTRLANEILMDVSDGKKFLEVDYQTKLTKIMALGTHDDDWFGIYDDFEEVFSPETIVHIPFGCAEIDEYLQGGLIKGNLVLLAASSGVGKTTVTTSLSESAATYKCEANKNEGFKVLQVFFEDTKPAIQRKHFGRITEIEARLLTTEEYNRIAKERALNYEHKELVKNNIRAKRFKNGAVTPNDLRNSIKKLIDEGFKPDVILIDYFECLKAPVSRTQDIWKLEAEKMRELENFTQEFNALVVVTTQGTKSSADGMLLTMDKIGGSGSKFQIGHVVITINRSQRDAEENRAELFIPKNREGRSGRAFKIILNNGIPKISVDDYFDSIDEMKEHQRIESKIISKSHNVELADAIKDEYAKHYGNTSDNDLD
jgi:hypothetical protein